MYDHHLDDVAHHHLCALAGGGDMASTLCQCNIMVLILFCHTAVQK